MRIRAGACFLAASLVLLPAQDRGASIAVSYSDRLHVSSRPELDRRLRAPFLNGTAHPNGVSNCTQWLDLPGTRGNQASDRLVPAQRSTLAECLVLRELSRALPARSSYLRQLQWDAGVLPLLPPQLAINASPFSRQGAAGAARQGRNWLTFDPSVTATVHAPDTILVSGQGFRTQLILWGRGAFDPSRTEELLVQSLDTLTEGTYRNTRLFILARRSPTGPLVLVRSLL